MNKKAGKKNKILQNEQENRKEKKTKGKSQ